KNMMSIKIMINDKYIGEPPRLEIVEKAIECGKYSLIERIIEKKPENIDLEYLNSALCAARDNARFIEARNNCKDLFEAMKNKKVKNILNKLKRNCIYIVENDQI